MGKTTTGVNLAAALAVRGRKTLVIDLDPQKPTAASRSWTTARDRSLSDVIAGVRARSNFIQPLLLQNLFVAPARIALTKLGEIVGELDAQFRSRTRPTSRDVTTLARVIDCPPALGLLTVNALVAAAHLLISDSVVLLCARKRTDDLRERVEEVRQPSNPGLRSLAAWGRPPRP